MVKIVKRISVITLIVSLLFANSISIASAKTEDSKFKKNIFQISPNESIDISLLDDKGFVKRTKITHPSKNNVEVTTTQYYIDDINKRTHFRDTITKELSNINEMQALVETHYEYDEDLDDSISYLQFLKVIWNTYESNGSLFGKVHRLEGGYTQYDSSVSVVSQKVCAGQCYGFSGDSYTTYVTPANSNWGINTYDKFGYITISSTSSYSCGGAYYDLELKHGTSSVWTNEIYTTGWDYGAVSLSDFLSSR